MAPAGTPYSNPNITFSDTVCPSGTLTFSTTALAEEIANLNAQVEISRRMIAEIEPLNDQLNILLNLITGVGQLNAHLKQARYFAEQIAELNYVVHEAVRKATEEMKNPPPWSLSRMFS